MGLSVPVVVFAERADHVRRRALASRLVLARRDRDVVVRPVHARPHQVRLSAAATSVR